MSDRVQQPLRTFDVRLSVTYEHTRRVRARTIAGAYAAARASADVDYPGAVIRTHGAEERRGKERES